jgi:hypothetical protein
MEKVDAGHAGAAAGPMYHASLSFGFVRVPN